jgi:hypothetical protein
VSRPPGSARFRAALTSALQSVGEEKTCLRQAAVARLVDEPAEACPKVVHTVAATIRLVPYPAFSCARKRCPMLIHAWSTPEMSSTRRRALRAMSWLSSQKSGRVPLPSSHGTRVCACGHMRRCRRYALQMLLCAPSTLPSVLDALGSHSLRQTPAFSGLELNRALDVADLPNCS